MLSQSKYAVHQQTVMLPQQYWRHLKTNYDLSSAFENADRLLEQKPTAYRQSAYSIPYYATNIIKQNCVDVYRKKYF